MSERWTQADIDRAPMRRKSAFPNDHVCENSAQSCADPHCYEHLGERAIPLPTKPSKYRNVKTVVEGITFDSKKESERYLTLKMLERDFKIKDLAHHRVFALQVNNVHIGDYEADFTYFGWDGSDVPTLVVEDVKSSATRKLPLYRWKKKHFEAQYGLTIREI